MPIEIESPEEAGYGTIRCNLCESSMSDHTPADFNLNVPLDGLLLQYGDHRGHPGLRRLLADESGCPPGQVLLTTGAAGALFIIATSLLDPGSHLVVLRPNYATNLETPRAIGCAISFVDLQFERGFQYTAEDIVAAMRPNTRLVSITNPHNPTGIILPQAELRRIVDLVEARGCRLLVDETYRDLTLAPAPPFATALSERVISVASMSKAFGVPGLRLGWLLTRDPALARTFLAAKEQMTICGPVIEEEIAYRIYRQRAALLPGIAATVARGRAELGAWIARQPDMEWVEPMGGVVAFPRIKPGAPIDVDRFYRILFDDYRTVVGPGHWFEQDRRYMRIGYGWPAPDEFRQGLENIARSLAAARIQ